MIYRLIFILKIKIHFSLTKVASSPIPNSECGTFFFFGTLILLYTFQFILSPTSILSGVCYPYSCCAFFFNFFFYHTFEYIGALAVRI